MAEVSSLGTGMANVKDLAGSTLTQKVFTTLRNKILSGKLVPGTRLKDAELAASLGVSTIPVREALSMLEKVGLVENIPHTGKRVRKLSPLEIVELYEVREYLEGLAARLAAGVITQARLTKMRKTITSCEKAINTGDAALYLRNDREFHDILAQASRNDILLETMRGFLDRIHILRQMDVGPGRKEASLWDHLEVLTCLANGDPDGAERAIRRHIVTTKEYVMKVYELRR